MTDIKVTPEGLLHASDHEEASRIAAELIVGAAKDTFKRRGVFHIGLSVGGTPKRTYELLAESAYSDRMPWWATNIYWADERCVPPDNLESNYRMVFEALLDKLPLLGEQIHKILCLDEDYDRIAREAEKGLPGQLDVVLLGIGEDGHTASLFPGSEALNEMHRKYVVVTGPKPPNPRITITPLVIESSRRIFVLATGDEKAKTVESALEGNWDVSRTPAQLARRGLWILDEASGARLTSR